MRLILLKLSACLICFCFGVFSIHQAHAMPDEDKYNSAEKIGFAFAKLSGMKPNFNNWVMATDAYTKTPDSDKSMMLQGQTYRLEKGFRTYDPQEDMIKISAIVMIDLTERNAKKSGREIPNDHHPMQIKVNAGNYAYFSFQLGGSWIAVIPANTDLFDVMIIDDAVYERLKKGIHGNSGNFWEARLEMYVKPEKVDVSKPMVLEQKNMWLMSVQVADLELWNKNSTELLWAYNAPWFISDRTKQIQDLYQNSTTPPYEAPHPKR